MADESKNVKRIQSGSRAEVDSMLPEKMISLLKDDAIAMRNSDGTVDYAPVEDSDATFNSLQAVNLAGIGTRNIGVDENGNVIVASPSVGGVDYTDYNPLVTPPSYEEGRLWYDALEKKPRYYSDNQNFTSWVNGALTLLGTNETGFDIPAGKAVDVHDLNSALNGFQIHLADSLEMANNNDEGWVIAITVDTIPNGEAGTIAIFGTLSNIDTSALIAGQPAYVGTAGALTSVRPNYPAKAILVGSAIFSNATTGVFGIKVAEENYDYEFDGCIVEKHQYQIVEGTGVDANDVVGQMYCDVWNLENPTRKLPVQLGGVIYQLDTITGTSPAGYARVLLNQGTDTNAQFNRMYIKINGTVAELAVTTGYPAMPFATVGRTTLWTASKFATDGVKNNRRTTSSKQYDSMGIIKTILESLGTIAPRVESNVTPTASIVTVGGDTNVMNIDMPEADIYQTFKQTFPNLSVVTDGIYIANGAGGVSLGNNVKVSDIKDLAGYTNIDEARDTSCTGTIFIFGAVNKELTECKLFANLPNKVGGTNAAGGRDAYFDSDGAGNYGGTADGDYTEFAIGRVAYHYNAGTINFLTSDGATTTSPDSFFPLINNPMGTSGGGGGAGGALQNLLQVLQQGNDGGALQIKNIADGTADQDAVTVAQISTTTGSATIDPAWTTARNNIYRSSQNREVDIAVSKVTDSTDGQLVATLDEEDWPTTQVSRNVWGTDSVGTRKNMIVLAQSDGTISIYGVPATNLARSLTISFNYTV